MVTTATLPGANATTAGPAEAKPAAAPPTLPRLAAIDVGTNSIRLVVAEYQPDGSYRVLDEDRQMTRLGRGLHRCRRLGEGGSARAPQSGGRPEGVAGGGRGT